MDRVLSRKFWLAVGSFITFAANGLWDQAIGVVIAYLGIQGVTDFKTASKAPESPEEGP